MDVLLRFWELVLPVTYIAEERICASLQANPIKKGLEALLFPSLLQLAFCYSWNHLVFDSLSSLDSTNLEIALVKQVANPYTPTKLGDISYGSCQIDQDIE